uniref:ATP synthase complex subunit 8 n=1 Tax=Scarabaeidae sp. BMNH 1274752 TaxID=1796540 RepID=A0A126TGP2_9SCAR|nr:ATP synthase F0 subunit 8 [Scarabaeidae sp. BMNH 1274752]
MPQMAPLNWLMLFIYFCMMFIIFNMMNYYLFTYKPNSYFYKKKINKINWKW